MNLGAFGVLIWIRNRRTYAYTLEEMGGLGRTMPWAATLPPRPWTSGGRRTHR